MTGAGSRYESLLPIGHGGMATVFVGRAHGARPDELVALKRAHSHVRTEESLVESMKLEARLASRLGHANVVRVLDVEDDGDLTLVLDYVEGCTLRTLLSKVDRLGEQRPRETIRILLDIGAGLHAAHQATDETGTLLGLVHRDVSPSNMLVGIDGRARISDFGIAKALFEGSDRTATGVLKGKTAYMAPEYVLHQHANAASDLFSLAVIAWESLSGERLFTGATEIETMRRVANAETRPLAGIRPELAPLDPVLLRALALIPSDRQASVEQFMMELEAVATAHRLIATHAEVGALVERVVHPDLEDRRRVLGLPSVAMPAALPAAPGLHVDTPTAQAPLAQSGTYLTAPPGPPPPVTEDPTARRVVLAGSIALLGALAFGLVAIAMTCSKPEPKEPDDHPVILPPASVASETRPAEPDAGKPAPPATTGRQPHRRHGPPAGTGRKPR